MKRISIQAGFTIVELLTVIAIIGILAATVLTSLNDARQEGINAKIMVEMDSVAKRAEIENNQSFTYDMVCGTNGYATSSVIADLFVSIGTLASSSVTCNSSPGAFAVSVPLSSNHWCVSNGGISQEIPAALTAGDTDCD